jgi:hypothetical protein
MISILFLLNAFFLPQAGFAEFSYCREGPRPGEPVHCLRLDEAGEGAFTIESARNDVETVALSLSPDAAGRLRELLEATAYLRDGDRYESGRSVANLGRKDLTVEGDWGRREAAFNYSVLAEVNALLTYLDRLVGSELLRLDLESALEFDRLALPAVLERIESDLRLRRLPDPGRLLGMLERIASDPRVVNYAREAAAELAEDIVDGLEDR